MENKTYLISYTNPKGLDIYFMGKYKRMYTFTQDRKEAKVFADRTRAKSMLTRIAKRSSLTLRGLTLRLEAVQLVKVETLTMRVIHA